MRREFFSQVIAAAVCAAVCAFVFQLLVHILSPHAAWITALSIAAGGHLAWLLPQRRQAFSAGILLGINALALLLFSPQALISSLGIAIAYALLRTFFRGPGRDGRGILIAIVGCGAGILAACWLGSWQLSGLAIAVWTYLLVFACADLLRGTQTQAKVELDAFSKAAQNLERTLRSI